MRFMLLTMACLCPAVFAQSTPGATFGTREPLACSDTKEPARGPLTAALATKYARCGREKVVRHSGGDLLYLMENAHFEVGKSRKYQTSDSLLSDIDPARPVYPIRGGFDLYSCSDPKQHSGMRLGANCRLNRNTQSDGVCYQTTFGDWKCEISYEADFRGAERDVPGPR